MTPPAVGGVLRFIARGLTVELRPYWREQILLGMTVIIPVALRTLLPLSLGVLIDDAIPGQHFQLLMMTLGTLVVLTVLATLAEVVQAHVRAVFGNELEKDLRLNLFRHLQYLPVSFFDTVQPGAVTSIFAHEVVVLRDTLRGLIVNGFRAALQVVATLAAMLSLNWKLTLLLTALLPFIIQFQRRALRRSEEADYDENIEDALVASAVQDNVTSYSLIRVFGLADQAIDSFCRNVLHRQGGPRTLNQYNFETIKQGFQSPSYLKSLVLTSANLQQTVLYVGALCIGAWLAFRDTLTVGTYSALLALILNLSQAVLGFAAFIQETISGATAQDRIDQIIQSQVPIVDRDEAQPLNLREGKFSFEKVSFAYLDDHPQISDLTFTLPGKGVVAFVGRSGCGKSTLIKLMLRLYDPLEGRVSLDGQDLRTAQLASLRGHVGVVLQDAGLFNASVRDNITIVRPSASDEEIKAAAQAAEVHRVIEGLPQGYQTMAGEGGRRLSPGQRQRIALARALLCQPAVLILDEISASLDPETEAAIHQTLRKLSRDRPVILMTHRLGSLADNDYVLVMERGRLAQQGLHGELLQAAGPYRQLWQVQSGFVVSHDGRHAEVTAERLSAINLFADLELSVLEQLARCFVSEHYEPGQMICSEGQLGDRFFILVRGRVRVLASGHEEESLHVATLTDGDYFGEDALLDETSYSTGIEADSPSLALALSRSDFQRLMTASRKVRETMEETALTRNLTLFGRRGRRPSRVPATWDLLK